MAELFEPTVLNGVALSNRFVRSATWEGLAAPGGYATEKLGRLLMGLAQGKVGLIITGHAGEEGLYYLDEARRYKERVQEIRRSRLVFRTMTV
ncbi:MAG: hypothetical protein A2169_01685 [Deltaproteobacteria bacterium RBG_13_47_9]|nr:MAG: hypothetical protein A2169_01685 [Deltaproteobacteria bacterium RBG_13_47_9]